MAVYEQVEKGGAKAWVVDFIWSDPATGKKRRVRRAAKDAKGRPAKSESAAQQHEHRLRAQLAASPHATRNAQAPTLAAYRDVYLADARTRLAPQTVDYLARTYRTALLPTLAVATLDAIDQDAIAGLVRALRARDLGAKSINNALSALRATLAHAADRKVIAAIPPIAWQKVPPTGFDFFTFDEATKLLAHAPPLVVVALRTGMRIGELLELQWSDVALDRRQLTVSRSVWWEPGGKRVVGAPKNNRARTIPLTADALPVLAQLHEARASSSRRSRHVFVDEAGQPLTPGACKWPLWRAQDAAGLRRTGPHVLRHTFASHLVMRGNSLPAVQALMGHTTIQMTMKYAHLAPDHLRATIDTLTDGP